MPASRTLLCRLRPRHRRQPHAARGRARAGNFFSAAFEDNCLAVAGASGGIFGMIGLYLADMILNFQSIKRRGPPGARPCACA